MAESGPDRKLLVALALVTIAGACLRIYGLASTPPTPDDYGVVTSAFDYMERGHFGVTMWQHPKLRNILEYCSLQILGTDMWGLKSISLLCGIFSIPLAGLIAKDLFKSGTAALLASLFLAIDPVHIDFSRQAVQEVHMPFFSLLGIWLALRYRRGGNPVLLVGSGLSFGLGISSKWYVAFPLLVTGAATVIQGFKSGDTRRQKSTEFLFLLSVFVLLPLSVYLLTYFPWFLHRGYGLQDWLAAQFFMYREAVTHQGFNEVAAQIDPNQRLWFLKPVAFADFIFAGGKAIVLLAISNPLVWMLVFPAVAFLLYKGIRERNGNCFFLLALFCFSYLPLAVASRPIWVSSSLSVIPFGFMGVAYLVATVVNRKRGKSILALYLTTTFLVAAPLYMLAIGRGLDTPLLRPIIELYRPANERQ